MRHEGSPSLIHPAFTYSAFDLQLRSNLPIPGLIPTKVTASGAPLDLHLGSSPVTYDDGRATEEVVIYTSPYLDERGEPSLRVHRMARGILRLAYSNGMQFWMDEQARELWALWPEESSLEDAATYLLGPVLGLLLRIRGIVCLHASAVACDGGALVFVGPPGAGKSTTAAILAQNGHAILSDDIVALAEVAGRILVLPAFPFLCLWPDSAKMLCGAADSLPRFVESWDKRCLSHDRGFAFETRARPLAGIFVLGERTANPVPCTSPLSAQTALVALLANSYGGRFLRSEMRAKEFSFLARLVTCAPVQSIRIPEASKLSGPMDAIWHSLLQASCTAPEA